MYQYLLYDSVGSNARLLGVEAIGYEVPAVPKPNIWT